MSIYLKILILLALWVLTGINCYNDGYEKGLKHGFIDGKLYEVQECIKTIQYVQEHWKCEE